MTEPSAAADSRDYAHALSTAKDPHLTSPFPALESDHETADAPEPQQHPAPAAHDHLMSLHRSAHDQAIEIINSYQSTARRRRSSVEAVAAASSVLASFASAAAAAVAKPSAAVVAGSPRFSATQSAAALLAASGIDPGMLPAIPSGPASAQGTPPPAESAYGESVATTPTDSQQQSAAGATTSNGMPLTPDAPGSGRPGSLRHLTPDERRARRLQRNRLAAKECRQKKKVYIQDLEGKVGRLEAENARLRKEIEELNAKLTLGAMRASATPVIGQGPDDLRGPPAKRPRDGRSAASSRRPSPSI